MKNFTKALVAVAFAVSASASQAAMWNVTVNGTVTNNADGQLDGLLDVGTSLAFTVIVDDGNPDADPAANSYIATDNSNVDTFLIVPVVGTAAISTTGSTNWNAVGMLDLSSVAPGLFLPYTVAVNGVGMTPDQILANFTSGISGLISVDMGPLGAEPGFVLADVDGVSITAYVAPVPLPAAAWLFGSALLGLAGVKRRKS